MKKTYFLHTVDGKPGYFDGDQICFAEQLPHWEDQFQPCLLRRSLAEIKFDEELSARFRAKNGWSIPGYGYVLVGFSHDWVPRSRVRDLESNLRDRVQKAARRGRIAATKTATAKTR